MIVALSMLNLLLLLGFHMQVFAAGDLSDPHGTHRVCLSAVLQVLQQVQGEEWFRDCWVWLYRGAWQVMRGQRGGWGGGAHEPDLGRGKALCVKLTYVNPSALWRAHMGKCIGKDSLSGLGGCDEPWASKEDGIRTLYHTNTPDLPNILFL
jgi:hypothetical protein